MSKEVQQLAAEIQHYLAVHPEAEDTLQGVSERWLARDARTVREIDLLQALQILNNQGFISATGTPDKRTVYRARTKGK